MILRQARAAIDAGVDLIQVREPDLEAAQLVALTGDIVAAARGTATRVLVNDRLDVALAGGAGGVHLRGDSAPATSVRTIVPPGFLIGRSVHGVAEAQAAAGADYLIAGTVFPSRSKPGVDGLGAAGLGAIVRATVLPVLAIGGITVDRADQVARSGAAGIAAIGLFLEESAALGEVVPRLRQRFDSVNTAP